MSSLDFEFDQDRDSNPDPHVRDLEEILNINVAYHASGDNNEREEFKLDGF